MSNDEKMLTTEEVADFLNVTSQTIYRWCRTSRIPHYNLNKNYRFRLRELESWLQTNRIGPRIGAKGKEPSP